MTHVNIEIKARCNNRERIRDYLVSKGARHEGIDRQIDTYFLVKNGRLKLREGNIENHLIFYERQEIEGPKQSNVDLFKSEPESSLKELLVKSLGVLVVVDKEREIYWIENTKFHLDSVRDLGSFVEIEAIDYSGNIGRERLLEQCNHYLREFNISNEDLIDCSYSDLLLRREM